jgi:hypothetical protein
LEKKAHPAERIKPRRRKRNAHRKRGSGGGDPAKIVFKGDGLIV